MTSLLELQQRMFEVVSTPLTASENTNATTRHGNSASAIANEIIKPNDRLTSLERLELYNRQYWWRILSSFSEDFVGLHAVIGNRKFDRLALAYLSDHPSKSFTLRNLGSKIELWLKEHPEYTHPKEALALDMARLEWAEIEAFDAAAEPSLGPQDLLVFNPSSSFRLQPHVQLLDLQHEVDDLLLSIRKQNDSIDDQASNAFGGNRKRARPKKFGRISRKPLFLAVHRSDYSIYFKRIEPEAFTLLKALREGNPLSEAIDLAFETSILSENDMISRIRTWFASWASWGWFCRDTSGSS